MTRRAGPSDATPSGTGPTRAARGRGPSARPRIRHLLALAAFVPATTAAVAAARLSHNVVDHQQHRLLEDRVREVSTYLSSSASLTTAALTSAADAAAVRGRPDFRTRARPLTAQGGTVLVLRADRAGRLRVVAALGPADSVADPSALSDGRRVAAARALTAPSLVYRVSGATGGRHLYDAVRVPGRSTAVALLDTPLPSTVTSTPSSAGSPYRDLDVAVYAGARPRPDALVLIAGRRPRGHGTVTTTASVGSDQVLLVAAARHPLMGALAAQTPWLVLGTGLVVALLLALLIMVMSRRRDEMLRLVEQRTGELHEARASAEAANRSTREFLSRVSHELRTPTHAVLGAAQTLTTPSDADQQRRSVTQITRSGYRLLGLLDQIGDFARIETGELPLHPEPIRVGELVDGVTELIARLAAQRGVHLLPARGAARDDYVLADRRRVEQILLNLLTNAVRYNHVEGTVSITCVHSRLGAVRIQVTDTGPGIAPDRLARLFVPFERVGTDAEEAGRGVGLPLSRRLAEAMNGRLEVDSRLGHGSTFWLELARVDHPSAPLRAPSPTHVAPTPAPPRLAGSGRGAVSPSAGRIG